MKVAAFLRCFLTHERVLAV